MAPGDCGTNFMVVQVGFSRLIVSMFTADLILNSFLVKDAQEDITGERLKA